jgi:mRNA interferase RelE/StbE
MAFYKIEWKSSAKKELIKLNKIVISRIIKAIDKLQFQPNPVNSKKLQGAEHTYRIRVGNYRIIYSIHSEVLIIEIIRIAHLGSVYKNI